MRGQLAAIAFVVFFISVFAGLLVLYGEGATAGGYYKQYSNSSEYTNITSVSTKPPVCELDTENWISFASVPVCVWNYAGYAFSLTNFDVGNSTIQMLIVVPILIIFMFAVVMLILGK